jgi:DMSO/TMAO reductase YedYZ molybdopterin-dependent catalytic subunit
MRISRREAMQSSAAMAAALSVAAIGPIGAAAQLAPSATPDGLVDAKLRNISPLPLNHDGSAVEHSESEIGTIDGVLWKTKATPDIEFDFQKMKVKLDVRGTANLSGILSAGDLEKLPRHSEITLLQCGARKPTGIVKWTGVRFSDVAKMLGAQPFAAYGRFAGSDGYVTEEDMKTLMHPQVMLAWMMNDQPLPPEHGAPMRLVIPFRYGARSLKAITEIGLTATQFPPPPPLPPRQL